MNLALASAASAETPKSRGQVLDQSPEFQPARAGAVRPPMDMLQPIDISIFERWRAILKVVIGRGTGAPKQVGVILVSLLYLLIVNCVNAPHYRLLCNTLYQLCALPPAHSTPESPSVSSTQWDTCSRGGPLSVTNGDPKSQLNLFRKSKQAGHEDV